MSIRATRSTRRTTTRTKFASGGITQWTSSTPAQDAADRYKAQTLAALRSRDQILEQFGKLARYHRPTDYGCICGKRNCEELSIIDAEWITDHIVRMYKRGVG
jgi:hypothetical protein